VETIKFSKAKLESFKKMVENQHRGRLPTPVANNDSAPTVIGAMAHAAKDLVKAAVAVATHDYVSKDTYTKRLMTCLTCQEKDSSGENLARLDNNLNLTCGALLAGAVSDPAKNGCGCLLGTKLKLGSGFSCPRGKW
jgi:hypothetical protein